MVRRQVSWFMSAVLLATLPTTGVGQNQETVPSFPSEAEAVTVDVVVLDSEGKPLRGLTRADFTLLEDGRPQRIEGFEAVDSSAPEAAPANPSEPSAAAVPARAGGQGRIIAFLVDDLGLDQIRNGADARKAIAGWIQDQADPRDAVVLVTTSGDVFWSGRIGSGRGALLATLERVKGRKQSNGASGSEPMSDWEAYRIATEGQGEGMSGPGTGAELARVVQHWLALNICMGPPAPPDMCFKRATGRAQEVYQDAVRRSQALYRLVGQLAESLEGLRGRKSIFVFSDGALRDTTDDSLERAVNRAQRANAVIYFIDSRGLVTSSMYSAQVGKPPEPGDVVATSFAETTLGVSGTEALAEETGGTSVRNTNDLLRGLGRVANESSAYYMLGFQPEKAPDGKWRKLAVKVNRSKVTVRARKGYVPAARRPTAPDFEGPLVAALEGGAPPHDLEYRVGVLHFAPRGAEREALMLLEVPFSSVQRQADADKGRLGILAVVRDDIGRTLARVSQDWPVTMPANSVSGPQAPEFALFKGRLRLAPGRYTLETAVQDRTSQRIGTQTAPLEIPATGTGLALSSVALIGSGAPAPDTPGEADPLRMSGIAIAPNLGVPYVEGTRELPFLVHVYSAKGTRAALTVDLRRGETTLGTVSPEMPEPDSEGHVVWAGSFPAERLPAGHYTLHVGARQGALAAQEDATFEIVPAPKAASAPLTAAPTIATDPRLAEILSRAGRYVQEYERTFRALVAEEIYTQWVGLGKESTEDIGMRKRVLKSDLVFTILPGPLPWASFRDVYEVDGQKVHDRQARLENLFVSGSNPSAVEQANAILHESARYNLGGARRTVNIPTLPLLFLHPSNQARFRFELKGRRRLHDREGIEVRLKETALPTLVSGGTSGDLPATGSFWVAPDTGMVLRSEVTFEFPPHRATAWVAVDYRPEPGLNIWVPAEMREIYQDLPDASWAEFIEPIETTAKYSNYRRFSVTTNEGVVGAAVP
jgi:VWFA-related protein